MIPKTRHGLYKVVQDEYLSAKAVEETLTLNQFHHQMGHISLKTAHRLIEKGLVTGIHLEPNGDQEIFCESCVYAKATHLSVPKNREGSCTIKFGNKIHSELWGPAPVKTKGKCCYYITYTNDCTHLTHLYLLRNKLDAFSSYKEYEAWCMTQLGMSIKKLHLDQGGEYMDKDFISYLKSKGTEQKLTVHDTPSQNSVAECCNCTVVEHICALLHASELPRFLWGEAARHVVWLMNRTSTKAVDGMTPYEATFGKKPDLRNVHEWGERVWI